jgi:hypothetical protein
MDSFPEWQFDMPKAESQPAGRTWDVAYRTLHMGNGRTLSLPRACFLSPCARASHVWLLIEGQGTRRSSLVGSAVYFIIRHRSRVRVVPNRRQPSPRRKKLGYIPATAVPFSPTHHILTMDATHHRAHDGSQDLTSAPHEPYTAMVQPLHSIQGREVVPSPSDDEKNFHAADVEAARSVPEENEEQEGRMQSRFNSFRRSRPARVARDMFLILLLLGWWIPGIIRQVGPCGV